MSQTKLKLQMIELKKCEFIFQEFEVKFPTQKKTSMSRLPPEIWHVPLKRDRFKKKKSSSKPSILKWYCWWKKSCTTCDIYKTL